MSEPKKRKRKGGVTKPCEDCGVIMVDVIAQKKRCAKCAAVSTKKNNNKASVAYRERHNKNKRTMYNSDKVTPEIEAKRESFRLWNEARKAKGTPEKIKFTSNKTRPRVENNDPGHIAFEGTPEPTAYDNKYGCSR